MTTAVSDSAGGHAAFRLRFRAWLIDAIFIFLVFFIGGIVAGTVFEGHPTLRTAAFLTLFLLPLYYEPFLLVRYGSTLGHRAMNIVVVDSRTRANLSPPKAALRTLVKFLIGVLSLAFMFATRRAQSLHDLAAGSEVRIRNPINASPMDYFVPVTTDIQVSRFRRIVVILMYAVAALTAVTLPLVFLASEDCLEFGICSAAEHQMSVAMDVIYVVLLSSVIVLGWTGRLPGCRPGRA